MTVFSHLSGVVPGGVVSILALVAVVGIGPHRAEAGPYPPTFCSVTASMSESSLVVTGGGYPAGSAVALTVVPTADSAIAHVDGTGGFTVRIRHRDSRAGGVVLASSVTCTARHRFPAGIHPNAGRSSHSGRSSGASSTGPTTRGDGGAPAPTGAPERKEQPTAQPSARSAEQSAGPTAQQPSPESPIGLAAIIAMLIVSTLLAAGLVFVLIGRRIRRS